MICLGRLRSGIFLVRQGQYFFVNISAVLFSLEINWKLSWFCQTQLKLQLQNLIWSCDSFILNYFTSLNYPTTHPKIMMCLNFYLNIQTHWIKQLEYLQENIYLTAIKKFLSKNDPSKSPDSKSISSQNTIFKQLKKKIMNKLFFWAPK